MLPWAGASQAAGWFGAASRPRPPDPENPLGPAAQFAEQPRTVDRSMALLTHPPT
jgi:hypothetical protein